MEPDRPQTAREAALLGARADKLPHDPAAVKKHVIASAIRLAGISGLGISRVPDFGRSPRSFGRKQEERWRR